MPLLTLLGQCAAMTAASMAVGSIPLVFKDSMSREYAGAKALSSSLGVVTSSLDAGAFFIVTRDVNDAGGDTSASGRTGPGEITE